MDTRPGFAWRSGKPRVACTRWPGWLKWLAPCSLAVLVCLPVASTWAAPATRIASVQGSAAESTLQGQQVVVEGLVTGDFQSNDQPDHGDLKGFFIETAAAERLPRAGLSEGLFVFDNRGTVDVRTGDRVRVQGTVAEYSGMTQVSAGRVEVLARDQALPAPRGLQFPLDNVAALEALEGMRVHLSQSLVIAGHADYDRYGEIWLALPEAGETRVFTATQLAAPGSEGQESRHERLTRSRILLDDGSLRQNPDPPRHPAGGEFTLEHRFRAGDTLTGVTGILAEAFGHYRIQPTAAAEYTPRNPRPSPPQVPGELRVASFNMLNYFTTLRETGRVCGPKGGRDCRGAVDLAEWKRQRGKLLAALNGVGADILGLVELENNRAAEADLVAGLNAREGREVWAAVPAGVMGSDAIRVGLIYRQDRVRPLGEAVVLDKRYDPDFRDRYNRPVMAQSFETAAGARFTVAALHLKSKSSDCNAVGDPDRGDGQANCSGTRSAAARTLLRWLASDPTGSGDPDVLILGDLNAYAREDPLQILAEGGYQNLLATYLGDHAYTYVHDGQAGTLDYLLASESLAPQVQGVTVWHINADEPDLIDYRLRYKRRVQAALYAEDAFRSSDHDPVVVGLDLQ